MDELFQVSPNCPQACAICLTTGFEVHGSWLNALRDKLTTRVARDKLDATELSADPANNYPLRTNKSKHSIRDRLEQLGVALKSKSFIRVAPVKTCNLQPNFLESKVNSIERWASNIKKLNPDLALPELKRALPVWESPRGGERFIIIKIYFKTNNGLEAMKDLLHGSKLNLVDGLPSELDKFRDKIYVTLPDPRERSTTHVC